MSNGKLVHGMLHPELGHMKLLPYEGDSYKGHCPYHGTCLEGMAAGPAIEDRWGKKAIVLKDDTKVWDMEAFILLRRFATLSLS